MARGFGTVSPVRSASRGNILLIIAGVFILFMVVIGIVLLTNRQTKAPTPTVVVEKEAPVKMVPVLVPDVDIQMGTPLEPQMFKQAERPQVGVDPRTVRDFEEIKGHFARTLVIAGQPLHRDMITSVRPNNQLTANIPEGYRAVTIRVDVRTSVEGFAMPGARVDVNWISNIKGNPGVKVIVQNATVLSSERSTDASGKPGTVTPATVTLLVTAEDAALIQLASTTGSLSLSLRGDDDKGKGLGNDMATLQDLISRGDAPNTEERKEGTVTIGGKKYNVLPGGRLVESGQ